MALGDVTTYSGGEAKAIELLASAIATNSQPSAATAGLDVSLVTALYGFMPEECAILLYSTAGSGTMTVTCRLWGYTSATSGKWLPIGAGTDAAKGTINDGNAIGESITDGIRHSEVLAFPGLFERLYLEITAIGGTNTAVTAQLVVRRGSGA